jgi:hypothetical protein
VFAVGRDDASAPQYVEKTLNSLSHNGNAALASVPATRDDQDLSGAFHLPLAKPRFRSRFGGSGRRERIAKIERVLRAETHLVERLSKTVEAYTRSPWRPAHRSPDQKKKMEPPPPPPPPKRGFTTLLRIEPNVQLRLMNA